MDEKAVATLIAAALEQQNFTLQSAKEMADRAWEMASKLGVGIVFSAVDRGGNLLLLHRMEAALLGSIDISINKAYTANAFQMPTHKMAQSCQPGQALYGVQFTNQGRVVIFGGGYPVYKNGVLIGAIGVSGGSVEEDMTIARYAGGEALATDKL